MRTWLFGLVLAVIRPHWCTAQAPSPSAAGYWAARLGELARDDARAGTLGSVGRRLWATRLLPLPGFRGEAHYIQHTPELRDPLSLEFVTLDGRPLDVALRGQTWTPTHSRVEYAVPLTAKGRIVETRMITEDDTFISRFELFDLPQLRVRWRAPLAPNPAQVERFTTLDIGAGDVELATTASLRIGDPLDPAWLEGEAGEVAAGGGGVERRGAASGGAVLAHGFARTRGQAATWRVVGTGEGRWTACVRYARQGGGNARLSLLIDGEEKGDVVCAPTGGQGDVTAHFAWARLEVGEIAAGPHTLALAAKDDGAEVGLDGVFLVANAAADAPLPPMAAWSRFDPLRGAVLVAGPKTLVDGVPFTLPAAGRGRACEEPVDVPLAGRGEWLHVLVIPTRDAATVRIDHGATESIGLRQRDWQRHVAVLRVGDDAKTLRVSGGVLLGVTRDDPRHDAAAPPMRHESRIGEATFHGVRTHVRATVIGAAGGRLTAADPTGTHQVVAAQLQFAAGEQPRSNVVAQEFAPEARLVRWLTAHAPRLACTDPMLSRLWTYRWFLVHHNTAWPAAGNLPAGPVVYEGRHGSWYPRVITFSTPHIVAETRWLGDQALTFGNVRAHLANATPGEDLPNVLVDWRGFRYTHWIGEAVVEACKVHGDRKAMAELVPALARNVKDLVARFDADGDGLLVSGDHYSTGMEFQPSFWFHQGYDNSKPQTDLERPDFNAYVYGSAMSLAEAARLLGDAALAAELEQIAQRIQVAVLANLWHAEDGFFYSVRAQDDDPARCAEVIGFYPFRFGLAGARAPYARALAKLGDAAEFYGAFPPTSCSRRVPVFAAGVQQWPGPGGLVQPCMWNGPYWPHAASLVIDAVARVVRGKPDPQVQLLRARADDGKPLSDERCLGELLRRFARFHCEGGDPSRPLLREYGDADSGRSWGCADYMHSTFNDLLIRHWAGLVPRFDGTLEVRPLDLGLGDVRIDDIAYHGHKVSIAIAGDELAVFVDGKPVGKGSARAGVVVDAAF